ncbi:MAG: hypothetical protein L3J95_00210 [Thermoplasmata archaeon]|nr:hypothetical protein [Thermoplasmata archaeon]MCI4358844.1 hypothetical protein [Thermoplasmata archaeon]
MTQPSESGKPVGGIGTMLMQSDVCPACGKVHNSRLVRYLPSVGQLMGTPTAYPTSPVSTESARSPRVRGRKPSNMPLFWPMPQSSEGYP